MPAELKRTAAATHLVELDLAAKGEVGFQCSQHLIQPDSAQQLVLRYSTQEVQARILQPAGQQDSDCVMMIANLEAGGAWCSNPWRS